jgi:hypothetical protein
VVVVDVASRRKFLKGFGLLGAVVAGASAPVIIERTKEVQVPLPFPKSDPNVIAKIEEQTPATITLLSKYGEIAPPPPPVAINNNGYGVISNGSYITTATPNFGSFSISSGDKKFVPGTEKEVSVKMVPGPDGELYLNVNGTWKKVLTA